MSYIILVFCNVGLLYQTSTLCVCVSLSVNEWERDYVLLIFVIHLLHNRKDGIIMVSDFLCVCVSVCVSEPPAVCTAYQMSELNASLHWEHHMWVLLHTLYIYTQYSTCWRLIKGIFLQGKIHEYLHSNTSVYEGTNCFYDYWQTLPEMLS